MLERLKRMRSRKAALVAEAEALLAVAGDNVMDDEDGKRYDELLDQVKACDAQIAREERILEHVRQAEAPASAPEATITGGDNRAAAKPFACFGEMMAAVSNARKGNIAPRRASEDLERLTVMSEGVRKQAAYTGPSGANESVSSDGGFFVQADLAAPMLESAVSNGLILSRVRTVTVAGNRLKMPMLDESSIATTVHGGVLAYWRAEADEVDESQPKFREIDLPLESCMVVTYASQELLQDYPAMDGILRQSASDAIGRKFESDIVAGRGAGRPTGLLYAPNKVTVSKEATQPADGLVVENIVKMWTRLPQKHRANAVWLMHPDLEDALNMLEFPVGTAGIPAYLPPGGLSVDGYSTLKGRPIIFTDLCSAIGDLGDVFLADLSTYLWIQKGTLQVDLSDAPRFLFAETAFRFIARANGMSMHASSLTIKNSTGNQRSPIVTLQAR
jgi:HK97 family phage major capsid protein